MIPGSGALRSQLDGPGSGPVSEGEDGVHGAPPVGHPPGTRVDGAGRRCDLAVPPELLHGDSGTMTLAEYRSWSSMTPG